MQKIISGIQQIGIGVPNVQAAWAWYRQNLGMDIPIFEEEAEAKLMVQYTGEQVFSRHAVLAINLQGGGGFEVWQFTNRTPEAPSFPIQLGDLGIFTAKIKCHNVAATHEAFKKKNLNSSDLLVDPSGQEHFFVTDPYNNIFQLVKGNSWFRKNGCLTGGAAGTIIGVSDVEKARKLYSGILGYDTVVYDENGNFPDLTSLPGGEHEFRRVLLRHSQPRQGGFCQLLGTSEIELIQVKTRTGRKIYENRFWGDLGFIHLCYDIIGMEALEVECQAKGFPFTINSYNSFDMGEAAGQFAYIEDPDGTLIEFVETHRIPILKKLGWYLNLRKRNPKKALPNWMLRTLSLNRVKN